MKALKRGDFAVRLPLAQSGIAGQIAEAFNDVAEVIKESTDNFYRISTAVGKEGNIHERMPLGNAAGSWARWIDAVNGLISDLVQPTVEVARVIDAVARGDLAQKMAREMDGRALQGEFLRIGRTVNTMV
ncbi:MAG TPA: HAMP domain-containing protein, partial [Gemmataceae bacterium]|nr:HAMP domain-containing protein [Gemmataceae bacterium]